ncbi:hypothetical protein ACFSL4_02780 [Streptomyces caeni]|uniref:Uncharacterized protein n=1 Tax=Streptomyces caeni TaxID=2307231 RepID=A0ABW4IIN1_9ACTN
MVMGAWAGRAAHDGTDPGKPRIVWNYAKARAERVDALVTDALHLLGHVPDQEPSAASSRPPAGRHRPGLASRLPPPAF